MLLFAAFGNFLYVSCEIAITFHCVSNECCMYYSDFGRLRVCKGQKIFFNDFMDILTIMVC